jgi:hypothetical protein
VQQQVDQVGPHLVRHLHRRQLADHERGGRTALLDGRCQRRQNL